MMWTVNLGSCSRLINAPSKKLTLLKFSSSAPKDFLIICWLQYLNKLNLSTWIWRAIERSVDQKEFRGVCGVGLWSKDFLVFKRNQELVKKQRKHSRVFPKYFSLNSLNSVTKIIIFFKRLLYSNPLSPVWEAGTLPLCHGHSWQRRQLNLF